MQHFKNKKTNLEKTKYSKESKMPTLYTWNMHDVRRFNS